MDFSDKIKKGAALLDTQRPGWRERINTDTLNVARGEHCILGQIYGGFGTGLDCLDISGQAADYGFSIRTLKYPDLESTTLYGELTRQWIEHLENNK